MIAVTYVFLGRLGLLLIGFIVGIVLHSSLDNQSVAGAFSPETAPSTRRRELGVELAARLLDFHDSKTGTKPQRISWMQPFDSRTDYSDLRPAIAVSLDRLTDSIIRDYVKNWYQPILPDEPSFPLSCRLTLVRFFGAFSVHLSRKRPADLFINFLTNASSIIIVFLSEFAEALAVNGGASSFAPADVIRAYLEKRPDSSLASILSQKQQNAKFKLVAVDLLQTFLAPEAHECEPVRTFLREIFANIVLEHTVEACAQADYINSWIVYFLEKGEPDLMKTIDAGVEGAEGADQLKAADRTDVARPDAASETAPKPLTPAQAAMEEAMQEAKRLSEMIASHEAASRTVQPESGSSGDIVPEMLGSQPVEDGTPPSSEGFEPVGTESNDAASTSKDSDYVQVSSHQSSPSPTRPQYPVTLSRALTSHPLTLHNATISLLDDSVPKEKSKLKAKPQHEYLVQVEPTNSNHSGWVITRRYADFEGLHEFLRRISVVSGVSEFAINHSDLPKWKGQTKASLREKLEKYLQDALRSKRLAECEKMKKFLGKEDLGPETPKLGKGFNFPTPTVIENMGKGVLGALTNAPKDIADGSKAMFEGVSGAFGAGSSSSKRSIDSTLGPRRTLSLQRMSIDTQKAQQSRDAMDTTPVRSESDDDSVHRLSESRPSSPSPGNIFTSSKGMTDNKDIGHTKKDSQAKADSDYRFSGETPSESSRGQSSEANDTPSGSEGSAADPTVPEQRPCSPSRSLRPPAAINTTTTTAPDEPQEYNLSTDETNMAIELMFALINETYSLSSAWAIRKRLLNAAKTFLLRPGNPNVDNIRLLLQDAVIKPNASDDSLATYLDRLRGSALPTAADLAVRPPPLDWSGSEALRVRARRLLVSRGMPQALVSIMGTSATEESLGFIFDCLQIEEVARGFVSAILLQALKTAIL